MIIFARAPGTTGWVEIKPEEELSHRGQFWEIRKFAVESDGIMPLARRLGRAEQALRAAGFQYHGPSEKWLASKASPDGLSRGYSLGRSIIHECPALVLPQSFLQKLGAAAQIIPLKGMSAEAAQQLVNDCNSAPGGAA